MIKLCSVIVEKKKMKEIYQISIGEKIKLLEMFGGGGVAFPNFFFVENTHMHTHTERSKSVDLIAVFFSD